MPGTDKARARRRDGARPRPAGDGADGAGGADGADGADGAGASQIDALLDYLYRSRGFDFQGYKRSSLLRRIQKRMQAAGAADFGAYLDVLEVDPREFAQLFNTILINVTNFFRDGDVWDTLRAQLAERVLSRRAPDQPLRVWVAGCASGEEAYTVAMVLSELMGPEAFCGATKIYATDVDDDALNQARLAAYAPENVETVPPALLEKYFDRSGPKYVVGKDLRRCVIFGRHNLIQDAPISRVDLLSCRNTLMYFNAETQAKVLARFHFALKNEGLLFLGKAEMLLTHGDLFAPVDLTRRIFAKVPRGLPRERPPGPAYVPPVDAPAPPPAGLLRLREAAFEAAASAQIVLDLGGALVLANERARALFGLTANDLGRPFRELDAPNRVELSAAVERARVERRASTLHGVEWAAGGSTIAFDVSAMPLVDGGGTLLGQQIYFVDASQQKRLQHELQKKTRELEVAGEALQSTGEELETTNEELQSSNEELETTNEELQSSNEELETMNEELQSSNEELETMNDELRQRGEELNRVNGFFKSILSSLRVGVVVLDHDLVVRVWNHRAEDLWGLRRDEAQGKHFLNLDIGLPVERLKHVVWACIAGESDYQATVVDAINRRGKPIACKVECNALSPSEGDARGAILLMEELAPPGGPPP